MESCVHCGETLFWAQNSTLVVGYSLAFLIVTAGIIGIAFSIKELRKK